jgi:Cdc6-like AAA superfamily ATPase
LFEILIRLFVKIEVHGHASRVQDDSPFVPQRPNSSALFTGREDVLKRLMDHFAPRGQGDRSKKSFLLYGMGGVGKTQICLKFVEKVAGR